jgi:hypothetical protein
MTQAEASRRYRARLRLVRELPSRILAASTLDEAKALARLANGSPTRI